MAIVGLNSHLKSLNLILRNRWNFYRIYWEYQWSQIRDLYWRCDSLSKYNVDARVWKIVSKDCAEYEIELALLRLKEEVYTFEEGYVEGKLFPINYLHLIVCHHLAEFYLGNKLYSKVWDA